MLLEQDRYSDVFVCVKMSFPLMEVDMHTSLADGEGSILQVHLGSRYPEYLQTLNIISYYENNNIVSRKENCKFKFKN